MGRGPRFKHRDSSLSVFFLSVSTKHDCFITITQYQEHSVGVAARDSARPLLWCGGRAPPRAQAVTDVLQAPPCAQRSPRQPSLLASAHRQPSLLRDPCSEPHCQVGLCWQGFARLVGGGRVKGCALHMPRRRDVFCLDGSQGPISLAVANKLLF